MNLTEKVKQSTLQVLKTVTPSLSTGAAVDVYSMVTFDHQLERVSFSNNRQKGNFQMEFLVSNQNAKNNYDSIIADFDKNYSAVFELNGVRVLYVEYGNTSTITDKTTGRESLVFTLNIEAIEKR